MKYRQQQPVDFDSPVPRSIPLRSWINQITWPNFCKISCKITFLFYKISSWKFLKIHEKTIENFCQLRLSENLAKNFRVNCNFLMVFSQFFISRNIFSFKFGRFFLYFEGSNGFELKSVVHSFWFKISRIGNRSKPQNIKKIDQKIFLKINNCFLIPPFCWFSHNC